MSACGSLLKPSTGLFSGIGAAYSPNQVVQWCDTRDPPAPDALGEAVLRCPEGDAVSVGKAVKGLVAAGVAAGLLAGLGGILAGSPAVAAGQTMAATTAVNVRSGPGTNNSILAVLYRGQKIETMGTSIGGWTKVKFNGRTAYVSSRYLTTPGASVGAKPSANQGNPANATRTMRTTAALNVRTGPSTSFAVVGVLPFRQQVTLTGTTRGNWAQISYRGSNRWVAAGYLTAGDASLNVTGKGVATEALVLRSAASHSSSRAGVVAKGTVLQLTGARRSGYAQIVWQGVGRWVSAQYVKPYQASAPAKPAAPPRTKAVRYTTAALNIRASSEPSARVVAVAPKGSALELTGTVRNGRAEVLYNGSRLWAAMAYLSATKPAAAPKTGYSQGLSGLRPNAQNIVSLVRARYPQIETIYGVRRDPLPDHPSGRAVDLMIPNWRSNTALGWQIANYMRANARSLNIEYVIYQQRIWHISRSSAGWRYMADRGGNTANHMDHIHITTR